MQLVTCKNGHRYDASLTSECPECAMFGGSVLPSGTVDLGSYNNYAPDPVGATLDMRNPGTPGVTIPMDPNGGMGSWGGGLDKTQDVSYGSGATQPTSPAGDDFCTVAVLPDGSFVAKNEQLVTGWLVCIEGPEKGKDYRIHNDNNYVGRSMKNDICIPSDATVSGDKHCVIAYDPLDRLFYIGISGGASMVRLNGRPVLSTNELKHGDILTIGQGKFIFVPLCGEKFAWNN